MLLGLCGGCLCCLQGCVDFCPGGGIGRHASLRGWCLLKDMQVRVLSWALIHLYYEPWRLRETYVLWDVFFYVSISGTECRAFAFHLPSGG